MSDATATLADGRIVRLGRNRPDPASLRRAVWLAGYVDPFTAAPPASVDYYSAAAAITATMLGNDRVGNCTCASLLHQWGCAAIAAGREVSPPTTAEALGLYGQNGGHGNSGLVIESLLKYATANGFTAGGQRRQMAGFTAVDQSSLPLVKLAVAVFGSVKIGVDLPAAWERADVWDVTDSPILGGHDVAVLGYDDAKAMFYVSSWGRIFGLTYAAAGSGRFIEECWAELFPDLLDERGLTSLGIDLPALVSDLALVGRGEAPEVAPVVPPWLDLMGGGL